jgi:hypothetical protein
MIRAYSTATIALASDLQQKTVAKRGIASRLMTEPFPIVLS